VVVFVIMVALGVGLLQPTSEQLLIFGANFGPLTVNQQWWRLLSCTFVHIGIMHLLLNMWCLWNLGNLAERMFGNFAFVMLYLLSGLGGSIASLWWNPTIVSAGASSAVFGVAGSVIAFLHFGKVHLPPVAVK